MARRKRQHMERALNRLEGCPEGVAWRIGLSFAGNIHDWIWRGTRALSIDQMILMAGTQPRLSLVLWIQAWNQKFRLRGGFFVLCLASFIFLGTCDCRNGMLGWVCPTWKSTSVFIFLRSLCCKTPFCFPMKVAVNSKFTPDIGQPFDTAMQ